MLLHELYFAVVHGSNVRVLFLGALVSAYPVGEPKSTVVVDGIDSVWKDLGEAGEIHAESDARRDVNIADFPGGGGEEGETHVFPSRKRICSGSISLMAGTILS